MMPDGIHSAAVVPHRHRFANTIRGLMWIRFRRWTAIVPATRAHLIGELDKLIAKLYKGQCETCGWSGTCHNTKRLAENDAVDHIMGFLPASIREGLGREELRLTFSNPDPVEWVPVVPHRKARYGEPGIFPNSRPGQ